MNERNKEGREEGRNRPLPACMGLELPIRGDEDTASSPSAVPTIAIRGSARPLRGRAGGKAPARCFSVPGGTVKASGSSAHQENPKILLQTPDEPASLNPTGFFLRALLLSTARVFLKTGIVPQSLRIR